jgi:hypothetical protein
MGAIMGALASCVARAGGEGPWSIEPQLGVSADYTSNPLLRQFDVQGEEHVAAIIDAPLRYDTDELEFLLRPNGRITNSQGYSSLASNYAHLDGSGQYTDDRDTASLQGELARDSSLYFLGGLINRIGVPRNTATTSADWTHALTERCQTALDASWQRVRYDEPADFNALVDYRYWSAGPTLSYAMSERNTLKFLGSYGFYESLNGTTQSTSENLQLGFVRQLTEIWTLSTSAGYSRSVNREKLVIDFFGFLFPLTEKANQDGTVYTASLTRQGERFNITGTVGRALQPTGFAFLSRQDSYTVNAGYVRSERWDFGLSAQWLKAVNPQVNAGEAQLNAQEFDNRYLNVHLTANWHWTPQWTASVTATRITEQYSPPAVSAGSNGVRLDLVRHFLRTQF